jgi:putative CocE/NonD family hydrolase
MPKVQVFLMGADTWLTGERWPLPETELTTLYLASAAGANTLWGDGMLTGEPAGASGPAGAADRFLADPANPVPTLGSGLAMDTPVVVDQRPVECRSDVLVYSTPVLDDGIVVAGDVEATLFVSADVPDTDIHFKLVDVYPDGPAYNVAETCLRLRYRDSLSAPAPLEPGKVYEITIKGVTTANYFAPGHRMRIELAGSNFPNCDRNWNTGGANEAETAGPVATVTVHHDASRPSRITYRRYTGDFTVSAGHRPS